MPWYIYALAGAVLSTAYYALIKRNLQNINQYTLGVGVFLSASALLVIVSLIHGLPAFGPNFYLSVTATGIINIIASVLSFRALQTTELSLALPMLSFTPAFLIATSFVLLKELPNRIGMAGIMLIVIGSYILNQNRGHGFLEPFKQMFKNKGVFLMLIVAFLYSISSSFDKMAVINSDEIFGSAVVQFIIGIGFLLLAYKNSPGFYSDIRANFSKFILLGIILSLVSFTINTAFTMSAAAYVISIKRLSILFAVLFGGLILKESNMAKRTFGAAIMVAGMILIILFK